MSDRLNHKRPLLRRKIAESEEWQISFADMCTQLMCFFILIAAVGSVDLDQYKVVSESLANALGNRTGERPTKEKDLQAIREELSAIIGKERDTASFEVRSNAVAVKLNEGVLFDSGRAVLNERSFSILKKIIPSLINTRYRITVEGHTDSVPIQSVQFPSNWELSSARACAVARFLIANGMPTKSVQAMGLADTKPLFPNNDDHGRAISENQARNRRVVILIGQN